jgi:hypothetical protein
MSYAFYIAIAPPPYSTLLKTMSLSTIGGTIKDVIYYENVECVIVNELNLSSQYIDAEYIVYKNSFLYDAFSNMQSVIIMLPAEAYIV